jgi:hypothetical protein
VYRMNLFTPVEKLQLHRSSTYKPIMSVANCHCYQ